MGDKTTLAKARQELEDLYRGVPDDSVDLTLKDLASCQQRDSTERKKANMDPINEEPMQDPRSKGIAKVPSFDFTKALEEVREHHRRVEEKLSQNNNNKGSRVMVEESQVCDDVSVFGGDDDLDERAGKRRAGIPHSNICARCSDYVYIFRHRCLVCGRVYCRNCVGAGMGEMTEGRKCVECLGRRFSQRYIQRAGQTGCCWRYPKTMMLQELKWAEKGPRRSGEKRYGRNSRSPVNLGTPSRSHASRSPSPMMPRTPNRYHGGDNPLSSIMSSTLSPGPHGYPI